MKLKISPGIYILLSWDPFSDPHSPAKKKDPFSSSGLECMGLNHTNVKTGKWICLSSQWKADKDPGAGVFPHWS